MKSKTGEILIFRMVHYQNLDCLLSMGLHCPSSPQKCQNYQNIGHQTLINRREETQVSIAPFGNLSDYVPFYFTYKMPMLYLIHKNKVKAYEGGQSEVIYLISTAEKVVQSKCAFVFTDRHAVLNYTQFFNDLSDLDKLDWAVIDETDYNKWKNMHGESIDDNKEKKQAEFLVYKYFPISLISNIAVYNEEIKSTVAQNLAKANLSIPVHIVSQMYY